VRRLQREPEFQGVSHETEIKHRKMEAENNFVLNMVCSTMDAFWRALMMRLALHLFLGILRGLLMVVKDPSMIFRFLGLVCTLCPLIWNCLCALDTSRLFEDHF